MQQGKIILGIDEDVEEGDLIEKTLPNGKKQAFRVLEAIYHNPAGFPDYMYHIEARVESAKVKPPVAPRQVAISGLHPKVSAAAGALFADGHFSKAVQAAFQAVEHEVQVRTGLSDSGAPLMNKVFSPKAPLIDVARLPGRNGEDEREGFHRLFAGAMLGVRNPRSHGGPVPDTAEEALEYLALASALMRRL
ncbi:TIGR02391 family protein [Actinomadura madurae]|uniref:TIGR02391 family protein n=1 Tax=Actinomadura madurae TaxID=1993 RepID=UPI00399AC197